MLLKFLMKRESLPIVAFNVEHDRDMVLKPALVKAGTGSVALEDNRWRCAQ